MNIEEFKELEIKPEKIRPVVEFVKTYDKKLNMSLCIPSVSHAFSICVEYAKAWFKNGFETGYFKTEFISGSHIMQDFRTKTAEGLSKVQKPALAIIPELDTEFDRDGFDQYLFGLNTYYNNCRYQNAFFKDPSKKTFIAICMELMLVKFQFKVKVSSKLHAIDLLKYIKTRFFCGATRGERRDLDFNIPTQMMLQVAQDGGFEISNGQVLDMNGFIYYLNSHSALPFMYKYRAAKGIFEYYIKLPSQYMHIRSNPVSMDEGEREGQLDNNYMVSFDIEVRMPCPKFYAYYTLNVYDNVALANTNGSYSLYDFCLCPIPAINSKGWNQLVTWDYLEDEDIYLKKEKSSIEFDKPLAGISNGKIKQIADSVKEKYLSPSIFIEFKLFNDNKPIKIEVDWENYILKTDTILKSRTSHIVAYVDLVYYNEYVLSNEKARITKEQLQFPKYP